MEKLRRIKETRNPDEVKALQSVHVVDLTFVCDIKCSRVKPGVINYNSYMTLLSDLIQNSFR